MNIYRKGYEAGLGGGSCLAHHYRDRDAKRVSGDPAWLHITDAASDRLDVLVKRVAAVRSDVRVSRPAVFSAIVLLAIGEV